MNSKILLGAAIGGVIGYLIGDHIASIVAPEYYTDEEIEEMLETNEKILKENEYHVEQIKPDKTIKDLRKEKEMGQKKDYTKYFEGENKEPLEKLVRKYNNDEEVTQLDTDDILSVDEENVYLDDEELESTDVNLILDSDNGEVLVDNRDKSQPYLLTREEWDDNDTGFEQVLLYYYEEDEVLTDDQDRPVRSSVKLLGEDALDNFGTFSDDDHVVYVCNPIKEVEYEVVRSEKAYSDVVLKTEKSRSKKKVVKKNVFEERDDGELEEVDGNA